MYLLVANAVHHHPYVHPRVLRRLPPGLDARDGQKPVVNARLPGQLLDALIEREPHLSPLREHHLNQTRRPRDRRHCADGRRHADRSPHQPDRTGAANTRRPQGLCRFDSWFWLALPASLRASTFEC